MKLLTLCLLSLIGLAGCGAPTDTRQQYMSYLGERCKGFGFYPNTQEFSKCLMTLDAANMSGSAAAAQQNQNYLYQKSQDYFNGKW
jgi:hypothetical protein